MSYYEDVYIKRIMRNGNTSQERIQNSKKKEFLRFLDKSQYKVDILFEGEEYVGSLQPNKQDESKITNYLLSKKEDKWTDGTILEIFDKEEESYKKFLILHLEQFTINGYNRYKVIYLNKEIVWIDSSGEEITSYIYLTGQMDKSVKDLFKISYSILAYKEGQRTLSIIMKTDQDFKRDTYLDIDGEAWKVAGWDRISIPGISFVTLEERLLREEEIPITPEVESNNYWDSEEA